MISIYYTKYCTIFILRAMHCVTICLLTDFVLPALKCAQFYSLLLRCDAAHETCVYSNKYHQSTCIIKNDDTLSFVVFFSSVVSYSI